MDQITQQEGILDTITTPSKKRSTSRRSFLRKGMALGGAGAIGAGLLSAGLLNPASVFAHGQTGKALTKGDAAILQFLAVLETLETDFWQQYNELGGIQDQEQPEGQVLGGGGSALYTAALKNLDSDMDQYIHDNTDDEFTHFTFLDEYLKSRGVTPAHEQLEKFRTLQGSKAKGAQDVPRLTNLMRLTVDTSWWVKYRSSTGNPDLGGTFEQAVPSLNKGEHPAIPRDDGDLHPTDHIQAIANTAAFHFAFIEQGGTSLYPSLAQRVTDVEVLRVLLSIGPTETMHFQTWQDKAGAAVSPPLAPLTDPKNKDLMFPDLTKAGEDFQPNLIMPEPTFFLDKSKFPKVSIIRPTQTEGAAMAALQALTDDGLFRGQSPGFFTFMKGLAEAADEARRFGS